jgi:superfamily I DNA/RNA helicase
MSEKTAYLDRLSPSQRQAATTDSGCLVVAVPGAGKTGTLAARATYLLLQGKSVGAVTFTRDGAMELRDRIAKLVPPAAMDRLVVGTFHSMCFLMAFPHGRKTTIGGAILRAQRSSETRRWDIALEGERRNYARAAAESAGMDAKPEEVLQAIEAIKAGEAPKSAAEARAAALYDRHLANAGKIDFQDIIVRVVAGIGDGTISTLRVDHLLVDEFQDTDGVQYKWILAHHRAGVRVTAVGDDDQSIYQFRRALGYKAMVSLIEDTQCQLIRLEENYRSNTEILAAAQCVIDGAIGRMVKTLVSHKGVGGKVEVFSYATRENEAFAIAERAKMHIERNESFAVLTRTNLRLDDVESALAVKGVPYVRADGDSILSSDEAAVMLDIAESLKNEDGKKRNHILLWAGIGGDDLSALDAAFGGKMVIGVPADYQANGVSAGAKATWQSYVKLLPVWAKLDASGFGPLAMTGIAQWMREHARNKFSERRVDLCASILAPREGETLFTRARSARFSSTQNKGQPHSGHGARLMTAHGAKGLEFDAVWVAGAEDGVWPDKKSAIDEERRLFYVAMTRARRTLILSCEVHRVKPSPFLVETRIPIEVDRMGSAF